jgi:hypothetical protein
MLVPHILGSTPVAAAISLVSARQSCRFDSSSIVSMNPSTLELVSIVFMSAIRDVSSAV